MSVELRIELRVVRFTLEFGQQSAGQLSRLYVATVTTHNTQPELHNPDGSDTNLRARWCVQAQRADKTPEGAGLRAGPPAVRRYGRLCAYSQSRHQTYRHPVAVYALSRIDKPIGIAEYEMVKALRESLHSCLPRMATLKAKQAAGPHDEQVGEGG